MSAEFQIIHEQSKAEFETSVRTALDAGWDLYGPVQVSYVIAETTREIHGDERTTFLWVAMTKGIVKGIASKSL